ncbi:hypothetical protein ACWIGW_36270 [Nocardia brasiliensis]
MAQRHALGVQLADGGSDQIKVEFDWTAIAVLVLAISGEHEVADFRQSAVQLAGSLADVRHLKLAGAAHLPNVRYCRISRNGQSPRLVGRHGFPRRELAVVRVARAGDAQFGCRTTVEPGEHSIQPDSDAR